MSLIEDMADEEVELIWGATFSDSARDEVAMTVIATGLS
jgi:cell division GTPase FtsZ